MTTIGTSAQQIPVFGELGEARTGPSPFLASGRTLLCLGLVVALGLALRGYRLSARSFWFDEAFSWRLIRFPVGEVVERTARDNHPPLYFLLLKLWAAAFGTSPLALRSLSVLFGGLTILGMYLFVRAACALRERPAAAPKGQAAALLCAALVALSAFQIRWSWEVRMYSLGAALAAFSSWALLRALRDPADRVRPWLLYALLALLFAYTHYYALFSIAAQAIFVLGYFLAPSRGRPAALVRDHAFRTAVMAGALVVAGWLPWLPVFLRQRAQVQAGFWTRSVTGSDVLGVCYEMFVAPENAVVMRSGAVLAALVCAVGLLALLWKAGPGECYTFTAAVVPFVLSLLVSAWDTKVFHLRYFVFAHLFFLAAAALLLSRTPSSLDRAIACALALGGSLWVYGNFWNNLDVGNRPGARAAAAWIAARRGPQEPVVVSSPWLYLPLLYHAHDTNGWRSYHDGKEVVHFPGGAVIGPDDIVDAGGLRALRSPRVWLVDMGFGSWRSGVVPVPSRWVLKATRVFPEVYRVQGQIVVLEYETGFVRTEGAN